MFSYSENIVKELAIEIKKTHKLDTAYFQQNVEASRNVENPSSEENDKSTPNESYDKPQMDDWAPADPIPEKNTFRSVVTYVDHEGHVYFHPLKKGI